MEEIEDREQPGNRPTRMEAPSGLRNTMPEQTKHTHPTANKQRWRRSFWLDLCIPLAMILIMFYGVARQITKLDSDTARYQCYATAFWYGSGALRTLPAQQCAFMSHPAPELTPLSQTTIVHWLQHLGITGTLTQIIAAQSPTRPFHALPHEYPLLPLLTFLPFLIAPAGWYQLAFATGMGIVALAIYLLLHRRSRGSGYAFALYLTLGSWATALGRFDLLPAALTLYALLCAERAQWRRAFAVLALASMYKFYPAIVLLPLLIAWQRQLDGPWYSWRRLAEPAIFPSVCILLAGISLLLNVEGTLAPLSYLGDRPLQVESVSASLVRLGSILTGEPLQYVYSFGSRNVLSALAPAITLGALCVLLAGYAYVCWLYWSQRIELAMSMLLILFLVLITGKVFSAQYLIWVAPLVAYVGGQRRQWLIGWTSISAITTLIYPFLYNRNSYPFGALLPDFYITVLVRNILLCGFVGLILYQATRRRLKVDSYET